MSSYDRMMAAAMALAVLALAGCGFQPLHGEAGGLSAPELEAVKIQPIADRTGQILRNELIAQMTPRGQPGSPRYVLRVTLTESVRELALRTDEVATRANLSLTAHYSLSSAVDGRELTDGTARSIVSYNILREDFATVSSQKNARERAAGQLSLELSRRISIYLTRRAASAGAS